MSTATKIEWADSTFNFWEGCQKNGPGCDRCYAEVRNARFAGIKIEGVSVAPNWGPGAPRRLTSLKNRNLPHRWNREHEAFMAAHGRRQRVFCSSLSDVFDNAVDPAWRADLFAIMEACPNLDWLVLTKRIGNVRKMVPTRWLEPGGWPAHVRIGATIVTPEEAARDIPKLLALPCPNFLSMEPLLGSVDLETIYNTNLGEGQPYLHPLIGRVSDGHGDGCNVRSIEWVIVGGETGPGARPMHPAWVRSLRDQCEEAGVPFLFKQWGDWMPADTDGETASLTFPVGAPTGPENPQWHNWPDGVQSARVGKKAAGRNLDGRTWDGFPT